MTKVTIASVSDDQNTVTLSNGIVLKAVNVDYFSCRDCYIYDNGIPCGGFYFCVPGGRKDGKNANFVIDESKCESLEVVIDGRRFTADNTADAKWLKDIFSNKLEGK
jgi:hypothetical protein